MVTQYLPVMTMPKSVKIPREDRPVSTVLRPLPIRVTQYQFVKLHALRAHDDLAVQEHVRRAIDGYLDVMLAKYNLTPPSPSRGENYPPPVDKQVLLEGVNRKQPLPEHLAVPPDQPGRAHQRGKTRAKVVFR
jgi:hypothetical protein